MLLGFISLLLSVFQTRIVKICVNEDVMQHFLPCSLEDKEKLTHQKSEHSSTTLRELLENEETPLGYCARKVINLTFDTYIFFLCFIISS